MPPSSHVKQLFLTITTLTLSLRDLDDSILARTFAARRSSCKAGTVQVPHQSNFHHTTAALGAERYCGVPFRMMSHSAGSALQCSPPPLSRALPEPSWCPSSPSQARRRVNRPSCPWPPLLARPAATARQMAKDPPEPNLTSLRHLEHRKRTKRK